MAFDRKCRDKPAAVAETMPQTLPGWILFACILVSGITAGSAAAAMLDDALGEGAIQRRNFLTLLLFGALLVVSVLLLLWVETR